MSFHESRIKPDSYNIRFVFRDGQQREKHVYCSNKEAGYVSVFVAECIKLGDDKTVWKNRIQNSQVERA